MSDPTNHRKVEHIRIFEEDPMVDRDQCHFDRIHLRHRALPELDLKDVDPSLTVLGRKLSFPLLISSMTGGDHDELRNINRNLAEAAEATGVAMAVGSQRVMFTHPEAAESFSLRRHAPNTLLIGNLGAVQLNYGFGLEQAERAVDVLGADALYLHLNPLQEAVQPEGDTNFAGLAAKIGALNQSLSVPLLVKEIGSGISPLDAEILIAQGIKFLDVAGSGGTSWSRIEHHRRDGENRDELGILFQDWGIPTPLALQQLQHLDVSLIASGGIRSALDMVKSCALGAGLVGMAKPFLAPALESSEAVVQKIEDLKRAFTTAMWLLGVQRLPELIGNDELIVE